MKEGEKLYITPKMGIIPELTKQNYEGLAKQLREPITNAVDAKAEIIYIDIQVDGKFTDLLISDDGEGMSDEIFLDQFLALGGSDKYDQEDLIGRIGIGFLACAPFCEEIEIQSRFKGSNRAFVAVLYSQKLYTESLRYDGMSDFEAGKVIKIYEDADVIGLDKHYTRIRLKHLSQEVINQLTDKDNFNNLKDELRKILPLGFPENPELFDHISPELKQALRKYSDPWSVKIFFNGEELIRRTYGEKPNEKFKDIHELIEVKAKRGTGKVTGYLIQSYSNLSLDWRCLISRYQNTTVEYSGYLGFKEKSSLQYITGELFLDGLDKKKAISINRNEFNEGNDKYLALKEEIHEILDKFSKGVYRKSRKSSEIRAAIKKKAEIKQKLNNVSRSVSKPKKRKPIQKEIIKKPPAKKKPPKRKEATSLSKLSLEEDLKDVEVRIVKKVPRYSKRKEQFAIEWENGTKPIVLIEEDLVREVGEDLELEGKKFKVYFIEKDENSRPCSIDYTKNEVNFNINHPAIKEKDGKIISIVFLLTYFYEKSTTKKDYRDKIIESLGDIGD